MRWVSELLASSSALPRSSRVEGDVLRMDFFLIRLRMDLDTAGSVPCLLYSASPLNPTGRRATQTANPHGPASCSSTGFVDSASAASLLAACWRSWWVISGSACDPQGLRRGDVGFVNL